MKLKYEFTVREIMDEYVVIPAGESAIAVSGMLVTNDVGAALWEGLKTDTAEEALVARLLEEFDTDAVTAKQDVAEFIANLRKLDLLEE